MSTMTTNASPGLAPGYQANSKGRPSAPLPHIDDLLARPLDIDPNQSIKRLLDMTEKSLRQSEVSRDFSRPALALKDYLRASILAVHVICKHKDYPALKDARSESARLHRALLQRISEQSDIYEDIKRNIIKDNQRTGVQPTVKRSAPPSPSRVQASASVKGEAVSQWSKTTENSHELRPVNGFQAKKKPVVLPKPQSLLGNAIVPGSGRSATANNATLDLNARFANLRGPKSCPGQDPRIKTYPIPTQKPAGPRQMPNSPDFDIDPDAGASALPKVPDAIYSPARGSVSGEAARLPTSTSRGLFSRTGSSASVSSIPSMHPAQNNDFAPTAAAPPVPEEDEEPLNLPDGDSITAEQLCEIMKAKWSILLVDVRSREEFDRGHIMSSSIICIEPSILLRENISSEEISESMVLSPSPEQTLFERRDSYDVVVFYDQSSEQVPHYPKNSDELVVVSLHRALEHLNYSRRLKRSPRVLRGGLDAWMDLMGPLALQPTASTTTSTTAITSLREKRNGFIQRKGHKFAVTSFQPADVKVWERTLEKEAHQTACRPKFPRTAVEFLNSAPVAAPQQSMRSPTAIQGTQHNGSGSITQLPAPPARPRAAVQRPSHSGLAQGDDDDENYSKIGPPTLQWSAARSKKPTEQAPPSVVKIYTGLDNPGNWCYANSILQTLFGSPGFGREVADPKWENKYSVLRMDDKDHDRQSMISIMSNLFRCMSTGTVETMSAHPLMEYCLKKSCKLTTTKFGGSSQQDAHEFFTFLLQALHEETNPYGNASFKVEAPATNGRPLIQAAKDYWAKYSEFSQSMIDQYWRGMELQSVKCNECNSITHTFNPFGWIPVSFDKNQDMTLSQAMEEWANGPVPEYACDHCKDKRDATKKMSLARMPRLLSVVFARFGFANFVPFKSKAVVSWDFNDFDFTPYFLDAPRDDGGAEGRAFSGPFRYECYAVVMHAGPSLDMGHYYAYVRDSGSRDPYAWFRCNDRVVTKVRIGSGDSSDVQRQVLRSGEDQVPYLAFFRRKDV